jgi:hypothetical protein
MHPSFQPSNLIQEL